MWLISVRSVSDFTQESLTLDLANDCFRFVVQHFEVISASSPHIYHSALVLTPSESIVQGLYKSRAQPSVRVVHGVPALWDPNAAATTAPFTISATVWSPCNKFVAIKSLDTRVCVLDPATLQRLQSFEFSPGMSQRSEVLAFSPDSRTLTSFIRGHYLPFTGGFVVSWDLQTGGVVSAIEWKGPQDAQAGNAHITYSKNGKMVAVLPQYKSFTTISIYDIVVGVHLHDVDLGTRKNQKLPSGALLAYTIWTHGESLRFATPEPTGITIWQVGFTPGATPTEVETVSIPDNAVDTFVFKPREQKDLLQTQFNPASCRLAFVSGTERTLRVWDGRVSKFLLEHRGTRFDLITFSPDGRFFACTIPQTEVCLWKESPTGYSPFRKLTPNTRFPTLHFSPNSESIITSHGSTIQLWHTKSSSVTFSTPTPPPQDTGKYLLAFLPDRSSAVIARRKDKTVTVLDLESGDLLLTIETSIEIYGLRPIENTIVVIGDEKAITWSLPAGDFLPDARMSVEDSTRTINFRDVDDSLVFATSISPDSRYIALAGYCDEEEFLDIYCPSAGWKIRGDGRGFELWFAPDGHEIWCATDNEAKVFAITQDALNYTRTVADIGDGLLGCPWGPSRGYKVTHDGWVLGAGGERLLMLPSLWKSPFKVDRVWNGKFLAIVHDELPVPVILELEP